MATLCARFAARPRVQPSHNLSPECQTTPYGVLLFTLTSPSRYSTLTVSKCVALLSVLAFVLPAQLLVTRYHCSPESLVRILHLIMKTTLLTSVGIFACAATALPSSKSEAKSAHKEAKRYNIKSEDDSTVGTNDVNILTYALVLEHLESAFYAGGLANFTADQFSTAGYDATTYANLQRVASDEANHVAFLTQGLTAAGANPPAACVYNFPYTDPTSFLTLATILEGVGVSAYLGAAADIASPDYLTAAGSILTVEARHASYLRAQINESPFPSPYDLPLDFDQVYSLASQFIVSCPSTNPPLGVTAFPALSVTPAGSIAPGSNITINTVSQVVAADGTDPNTQLYGVFLTPIGPVFQPATRVATAGGAGAAFTVQVPATGVAGQSYVLLTACADRVTDDTTIAGPALLEVAPQPLMQSTS